MTELAKVHISLTDDSAYSEGSDVAIPLYVFATQQDKVLDETTGEIALGTTKALANKLLTITSKSDCINTFGIPYYETVDGTVQQASELNEHGLFGLFDALGSSAVAYALRADIDTNQLKGTTIEPTSDPKNGTLWLDLGNTSYGLFVSNGNANVGYAWDKIENITILLDNDIEGGKPVNSIGVNGDYGVYVDEKQNKISFFQKQYSTWTKVGSADWAKRQMQKGISKNSTFTAKENALTINDTVIATSMDTKTVSDLVSLINAVNISGITASVNVSGSLVVVCSNLLDNTLSISGDIATDLGMVVYKADMTFAKNQNPPMDKVAGSVWLKTNNVNGGAEYLLKKYMASTKTWSETVIPVLESTLDAETHYGTLLASGNVFAKYNETTDDLSMLMFTKGGNYVETSANPTISTNGSFDITTYSNGIKITSTVIVKEQDDKIKIVNAINSALAKKGVKTIDVSVSSDEKIRLISEGGYTIAFKNRESTPLTDLGLLEQEYSINWTPVSYIASENEPTNPASEGTYWFDPSFNVDIMVNNGNAWVGYKNRYPNAKITVSSEEPTVSLSDNDLWINPADESYPAIRRYLNGEWSLIDNTDQSTPLGIVFADVRPNAGPKSWKATNGLVQTGNYTAFSILLSDLMLSDYVDPNAIDARNYPAGILLFNTMASTNNVKVRKNTYETAVKDSGSEYTIAEGTESQKTFAMPGSNENPETYRWELASGLALDGSGLFGAKAQRQMIIKAMAEAIVSNEEIRTEDNDFFFAVAPGYPELDDEFINLNTDKKDMFYHVSDTPKKLAPNGTVIQNWAKNANNASSNGDEGRVLKSPYQSRQYPPMGLTSNVDGSEIAIPSSIVKMKNLLVLPRGQVAAGTQNGVVSNASSVGYITVENEYTPVTLRPGLGEVLVNNSIIPIMYRTSSGLTFWGESTENTITSAMSDEHTILTILRLKRELQKAVEPFFFRIITPQLINDFDASMRKVLNDYVGRDELEDYALVTDSTVNTPERRERKELWGELAILPPKCVEQIYIPIRVASYSNLNK